MRKSNRKIDIATLHRNIVSPMRQTLDEIRSGALLPETAFKAIIFTDVAIDLANATGNDTMLTHANFLVSMLGQVIEGHEIDEETLDQAQRYLQSIALKFSQTPIDKFVSAMRTSEIRIKMNRLNSQA